MSGGQERLSVLHIITGLGDGGAEAVLYRLCTHDTTHRHTVVSLMDRAKYGTLLCEAGVDVHCLAIPAGRVTFGGLARLWRVLRRVRPDIVQTWMYHADLLGGVIARLAGIRRVFWGLRSSTLEPGKAKGSTRLVAHVCARLSGVIPERIVCCAGKAAAVHAELGYDVNKLVVIPNGYNLEEFRPDIDARARLRRSLAVSDTTPLLGLVARFDPQKDHENLIRALALLDARREDFHCILVGRGIDQENAMLMGWIDAADLRHRVSLLGQRRDVPAVMNGLDLHLLSSCSGEAFPNVLAEAMACGTPCVTTDVGDAAAIVGETGWVVAPRDPSALAGGIAVALRERREGRWQARQHGARQRIEQLFSIERMVNAYSAAWCLETLEK